MYKVLVWRKQNYYGKEDFYYELISFNEENVYAYIEPANLFSGPEDKYFITFTYFPEKIRKEFNNLPSETTPYSDVNKIKDKIENVFKSFGFKILNDDLLIFD